MPTDDVQDLFDTGGDDEAEDAAERADDDSEDSVAWDELESIDDEPGADPARTAPDASRTADDGGDEEADAPSMDYSTGAGEPAVEADEREPQRSDPTNRGTRRSDDSGAAVETSATDASGDRDGGTGSSPAAGETPTTDDEAGGTEAAGTTPDERADGDGFDMEMSASGADAAESPSPDERVEDPTDDSAPDSDDARTAASDSGPADAATSTDDGDEPSPEVRGSVASDAEEPESPSATASGSSRLPTGIDPLDRVMGGGVPPGRLVLLVADPGVQSELLLDSVLAQRDTLFVSTDRPDWEVSKDIEPGLGSGEIEVRDHTPDSLLSGVDTLLDELGTTSNFVLDSVNELELVPRARYRIFLSDVKQRLFDTGSIGLLTGVTVDHESARDLTLRRADIVWRLETRTVDDRIENRLSVPKFRGGAAVTETVKLELTDEVKVDASWEEG